MFAVVGLAHAPLVNYTPAAVLMVTGSPIWSPQVATANAALVLCFAAFVAWLAFTVFDTHAGVTILPRRWRIGAPLAAWCVVQEAWTVSTIVLYPAEQRAVAEWWFATFVRGNEYLLGWSSAVILMHAAAEEIVYRALLLRALEGTMGAMRALVVQALAFELAHAMFYGYGVSGIWFIGGLALGYAFQRTRSLAVPTLLHAAHNSLFFALVWYFNQ